MHRTLLHVEVLMIPFGVFQWAVPRQGSANAMQRGSCLVDPRLECLKQAESNAVTGQAAGEPWAAGSEWAVSRQ